MFCAFRMSRLFKREHFTFFTIVMFILLLPGTAAACFTGSLYFTLPFPIILLFPLLLAANMCILSGNVKRTVWIVIGSVIGAYLYGLFLTNTAEDDIVAAYPEYFMLHYLIPLFFVQNILCIVLFQRSEQLKRGIVILGIITVIYVVQYFTFYPSYIHIGLTTCQSNMRNLGTALEMYSTDYNGLYPEKLEEITPEYLKEIPRCCSYKRMTPSAKKIYEQKFGFNVGDYGYSLSDDRTRFTLSCYPDNHSSLGITPMYSSENGSYHKE